MRSGTGGIAVSIVALLLGVLAVTQVRSQEVFSRSLELETPASLTTVIASLAERNSQLRDEIFDLRIRLDSASSAVSSGANLLDESQRQIAELEVLSARTPVRGPGVSVRIDGQFDERALSDLVNELRNAGAEAIEINGVRVGPRSYFVSSQPGSLGVGDRRVQGPWTVRAIGSPEVIHVALTRTGGIVGQFELIYAQTRFTVTRETMLELGSIP